MYEMKNEDAYGMRLHFLFCFFVEKHFTDARIPVIIGA